MNTNWFIMHKTSVHTQIIDISSDHTLTRKHLIRWVSKKNFCKSFVVLIKPIYANWKSIQILTGITWFLIIIHLSKFMHEKFFDRNWTKFSAYYSTSLNFNNQERIQKLFEGGVRNLFWMNRRGFRLVPLKTLLPKTPKTHP